MAIVNAKFTRELKITDPLTRGPDVEGVGRALARAGFLDGLTAFMQKTVAVRRTYGAGKARGVNRARAKLKLPQNGVYNRAVHDYLVRLGAFDARASWLMLQYEPPAKLVYPIPYGQGGYVCQGLHPTAGVPGNWAIDFCAGPGTGIVAVEPGWIYRLSGRDPNDDTQDPFGAYGWSVYLQTKAWGIYYVTHLGWRPPELRQGLPVAAGDLIGKVGDQAFRLDHVHYGYTSPMGEADAKAKMLRVVAAPRIR